MTKQDYAPDWANIEPEYKWVAVDFDGLVCKFTHEPVTLGKIHVTSFGAASNVEMIDPPGENWKTMIYERPDGQ